jgi:hypothetical protein
MSKVKLEDMVPGDVVWCVELQSAEKDKEAREKDPENESFSRRYFRPDYVHCYVNKGTIQAMMRSDGTKINVVLDEDDDRINRKEDSYDFYPTLKLALIAMAEELMNMAQDK